jgi:hypothetical protein
VYCRNPDSVEKERFCKGTVQKPIYLPSKIPAKLAKPLKLWTDLPGETTDKGVADVSSSKPAESCPVPTLFDLPVLWIDIPGELTAKEDQPDVRTSKPIP